AEIGWAGVDKADPQNPVGVKGVGEPVQGSGAAAVTSAISDALDGHLFNRTPVSLDMILNFLSKRPQAHKPLQINTVCGRTAMMIKDVMPSFELFQPTQLKDAFGLLDRYGKDSWKMAGGYDSLSWFKERAKKPKAVIDLSGIAEMKGIRETADG